MKASALIATIFITVFSMVYCSCAAPGTARKGDVDVTDTICTLELTQSNSGDSIAVTVGDSLCITLESNPGTGYNWVVDEIDSTLLVQISVSGVARRDNDTVGGLDYFTYRFRTLAPGQTTLRLAYRRGWEENNPAVALFEITVNILSAP